MGGSTEIRVNRFDLFNDLIVLYYVSEIIMRQKRKQVFFFFLYSSSLETQRSLVPTSAITMFLIDCNLSASFLDPAGGGGLVSFKHYPYLQSLRSVYI